SGFSVTGGAADHRLRVKPTAVPHALLSLARELQAQGLNVPNLGVNLNTIPRNAEGISSAWIQALAADLMAFRGESVIAAGQYQPAAVHAIAHALNQALGNVGHTVEWKLSTLHALNAENPAGAPENGMAGLRDLATDLDAGRVSALVVLDANPVHTAPADLELGARISRAAFSATLTSEANETSAITTWQLPLSHFLETWGDGVALDGTASIAQPLIAPLYDTLDAAEVLARLTGYAATTSHDIVRAYWASRSGLGFETAWRRWLHDGIVSQG